MEIPNFYVLEETVRSCDIGPDYKIKMRPLLHCLQEAAVGHSRQARDEFPEQLRRGSVWVLTRLRLRMDRFPRWEETIRIETWSAAIESLYAVRDFRIEDESGVCGAATTQWILIDVCKRRPIRIPPDLGKGYGRRSERALADAFDPLPCFHEPQFSHPFSVQRSDLDSLNHVNNAFYADWCLDAVPNSRVEGLQLMEFEAAYKKEAVYGDILNSQVAEEPDVNGEAVFLHRLARRSTEDIVVEARSRWRRL
ncbi:MAG: acyl-ACP thioesterase domain-containing protein [Candidatus Omnitrophota bacterium]